MFNVTIDDTNLAAITYAPPSCTPDGQGWASEDQMTDGGVYAYNATFRYCHSHAASATFRFTGVAVYLMAPGVVSEEKTMCATLDGLSSEVVNVASTGSTGAYTPSHVVWSATGLTNTEHTLVLSPGASGYIGVDAFIYTTESLNFLNAAASPIFPRDGIQMTLTVGLIIGLGIAGVLVVGFTCFFFGFYFGRRRPYPTPRPRSVLRSHRSRTGSEYSYGGLASTDLDHTHFVPTGGFRPASLRQAQAPVLTPMNSQAHPPAPSGSDAGSGTGFHSPTSQMRSSHSVHVEMPHASFSGPHNTSTAPNLPAQAPNDPPADDPLRIPPVFPRSPPLNTFQAPRLFASQSRSNSPYTEMHSNHSTSALNHPTTSPTTYNPYTFSHEIPQPTSPSQFFDAQPAQIPAVRSPVLAESATRARSSSVNAEMPTRRAPASAAVDPFADVAPPSADESHAGASPDDSSTTSASISAFPAPPSRKPPSYSSNARSGWMRHRLPDQPDDTTGTGASSFDLPPTSPPPPPSYLL